jgi:hypothetical protein
VVIGDSKSLYQSGKGLGHLERGLWAAFATLDQWPRTCAEVWNVLAPDSAGQLRAVFGYCEDDAPAPLDADPNELERLRPAFCRALCAAGVRLVAIASRAVFPEEFNAEVERRQSKGTALSHWTLELAA